MQITNRWFRSAAVALIAAPGLALFILALAKFDRQDVTEYFLLTGLAAYWLLPIAAGALWGARDPVTKSPRFGRWLLAVLPFAIAGCIAGINITLEKRDQAKRLQLRQAESKREWALQERRLSKCARTLNANLGEQDAVSSARFGDRRLLGLEDFGQEIYSFHVPVLNVSDGSSWGAGRAPDYLDARVGDKRLLRRFYVKVSPKGLIWSDPWGDVNRSMGRAPDSASACTNATNEYARGYNETMLRLGAASTSLAKGSER